MLPALTLHDHRYERTAYAIFGCELHRGHLSEAISRTDVSDDLVSQLRGAAEFAIQLWTAAAPLLSHVAHIVGVSANEEVIRADARWIVAMVKDIESLGDRTVFEFIGETVGKYAFRMTDLEATVALLIRASSPNPTGICLSDLFPETLVNRPAALAQMMVGNVSVTPRNGLSATARAEGGRGRLRVHREVSFPGATPEAVSAALGPSPAPILAQVCDGGDCDRY